MNPIGMVVGDRTVVRKSKGGWTVACKNGHEATGALSQLKKARCIACVSEAAKYKAGDLIGDRKVVGYFKSKQRIIVVCREGHRSVADQKLVAARGLGPCMKCKNSVVLGGVEFKLSELARGGFGVGAQGLKKRVARGLAVDITRLLKPRKNPGRGGRAQ